MSQTANFSSIPVRMSASFAGQGQFLVSFKVQMCSFFKHFCPVVQL
jgi:hypothetical protein